jgi:hypothetical protein
MFAITTFGNSNMTIRNLPKETLSASRQQHKNVAISEYAARQKRKKLSITLRRRNDSPAFPYINW